MIPRSRLARALLGPLALAAIVIAIVVPPDARLGVARIAVIGAGIVVTAVYLRRVRSVTQSTPERFELELRRTVEDPPVIASLRAAEMAVRFSVASANDFNVRLRPMLGEIARWRLLTNRGVDMDRARGAASRILGPGLSSLIAEPAEPPPFRAPGVPLADLDAALDQLEQI